VLIGNVALGQVTGLETGHLSVTAPHGS